MMNFITHGDARDILDGFKGDTVYVKISGCADKRKSAIWNWVIF